MNKVMFGMLVVCGIIFSGCVAEEGEVVVNTPGVYYNQEVVAPSYEPVYGGYVSRPTVVVEPRVRPVARPMVYPVSRPVVPSGVIRGGSIHSNGGGHHSGGGRHR